MKTKLLKKIRKRFSVVYYPKIDSSCKYRLIDKQDTQIYTMSHVKFWCESKDECLSSMMYIIRREYEKYSCKKSNINKCKKVWHNN